MKSLVIYHANCADGFGAAFAAWLKLGDEAEYVPMHYNKDVSPDMMAERARGREVYILDFSFPNLVMEHVFAAAKRVVWLDHHKTAFEMWCPNGERELHVYSDDKLAIRLDNNKSGAYLAWEHFHPEKEVPRFIKHIDDYDRWQFKLEGTKALNKALWSYAPWSFENWTSFIPYKSRTADYIPEAISEGEAILRAHAQNVQSVVKESARKCHLVCSDMVYHSKTGLAANCPPHLTSDVGHELANRSGTFGLCWHLDGELVCYCSLRSNGDYDVSSIAKAFGGGGHKNAAGFVIPINALLEWLS